MSHVQEVKGQIKLKFKNKVGHTMVCQRDLQVTQARSKYSYKALDATLMMMHTPSGGGGEAAGGGASSSGGGGGGGKKEMITMTKTTTAMDGLMPELLGVPKAVLEHVVFWCV